MAKDTGGSAFPTHRLTINGDVVPDEEGMTLRDYFAAKAMQALIASGNVYGCAVEAYQVADAMIEVRNKQ